MDAQERAGEQAGIEDGVTVKMSFKKSWVSWVMDEFHFPTVRILQSKFEYAKHVAAWSDVWSRGYVRGYESACPLERRVCP